MCVFDSFCLFVCLFLLCLKASGILVPRPGIEPRVLEVDVLSPNHWTARKFPRKAILWNKQTFFFKKHALFVMCSVMSDSLQPPGL